MNKKFAESQRRTARRTARRIIVALATLAFDVARPLRLEHEARELRRAADEEQPQAFMQKRDRFEAAFTVWNQQREGLAFVAALEQTIETIDSPSQALREYGAVDETLHRACGPDPTVLRRTPEGRFGQVISLRTTMVSVRAVFARSSYGRPRISEDVRKLLGTRSSSVVLSCRRWRHHLHTVGVNGSSPLAPTRP